MKKLSLRPYCTAMLLLASAVSLEPIASYAVSPSKTPASAETQRKPQPSPAGQCRKFVEDFYAWYLKKPQNDADSDDTYRVLKLKGSSLSPELRKGLKEDADAQAKVQGEIVGLDFDPFYSGNSGPADRYVVGKVTPKNGSYFADVYGITSGVKDKKPVVIAELKQSAGHWYFTNIHYGKTEFPQNENLLSVLAVLKADRLKH